MKHALVVTSIAQSPTPALKALAEGAKEHGWPFYLIGDAKSPGARWGWTQPFVSIQEQERFGFSLVGHLPVNHYARKNLGYLLAMRDGADVIVETDDDNKPDRVFWNPRNISQGGALIPLAEGWADVYSVFFPGTARPRGFSLEHALDVAHFRKRQETPFTAPIQQGMADIDPDVDAIFRLTMQGDFPLRQRDGLRDVSILLPGRLRSWCPINSQNTTWFKPAFPLLYLPSTCNSRCSDIWRGLIAQRIVWTVKEWGGVLFHGATVTQHRNPHDLLKDFEDEIPLYLYSGKVAAKLESLKLRSGVEMIPENLCVCCEALVDMEILKADELLRLGAWLKDVKWQVER